jgi:hypothetical protein
MLPALLYERLSEMGLDFAIAYPDHALFFPAIRDHEVQLAAYRCLQRDGSGLVSRPW